MLLLFSSYFVGLAEFRLRLGNETRGYLDLTDATQHKVAYQGIRANPTWHHNALELPSLARVQYVDESAGELLLNLTVHLAGGDPADLIESWRNIALRREDVQRYYKFGDGDPVVLQYKPLGIASGSEIQFLVTGVEWPPFPDDGRLVGGNHIVGAPLTLHCQPYARGITTVTSTPGSDLDHTATGLGSPAGFTADAVGGDVQGPAIVAVQNTTAAELRYLSLAFRSRGTVGNFIDVFLPGSYQADVGSPPHQYSVSRGIGAGRISQVTVTARVQDAGARQRFRFIWGQDVAGTITPTKASGEYETTASWVDYTFTAYVNPYTGLPWQETDLNAGDWGIENVSGGEVRVTKLSATVTYLARDAFATQTSTVNPTGVSSAGSAGWTQAGGVATVWGAWADAVDANYFHSSSNVTALVQMGDFTTIAATHVPARVVMPQSLVRNWDFEITPAPWYPEVFTALHSDGFEGVYAAGVAPNWTAVGGATHTESVTVHGGTDAQAISSVQDVTLSYQHRTFGGLQGGSKYRLSIWMQVDSAAGGDIGTLRAFDGTNRSGTLIGSLNEAGTSYVQKTMTFIAASGNVYVELGLSGGLSGVHNALFDDLAIELIDEHPADWAKVGAMGGYRSTTTGVAHGSSAFGLGHGDGTTIYYTQSITVVNGATYRAKATITGNAIVSFRFAGVEVAQLYGGQPSVSFTATGTTLEIRTYASGASAASVVDALRVVRTDATEIARFTMDSSGTEMADQLGEFAIRLRGRSSDTVGVQHRYAGSDGGRIRNKSLSFPTSTGVRLTDAGVMRAPPAPLPDGATLGPFVHSVHVDWTSVDAINAPITLDLDWVERIPIDEGGFWEEDQAAGAGVAEDESFVADSEAPRGAVTYKMDDTGAVLDVLNFGGTRLLWPKEACRVFVLMARSREDHRLSDTFLPSVTRYPWFIGFGA